MTKCSVGICRNRRAGSNRLEARAAPGAAAANRATSAVSAQPTVTPSPRVGVCVVGPMRNARKHQTENQRWNTEQASADKEQPVGLEQRPADREPLHDDAGKSLGEFSDVGIHGAQKRVLRRRVTETR